jgi:uncharacterized repeat protein (TIGR01451 family)
VVIKDAVPNHEQDFCFTVEEADLLLTLDNNSLYDEYLEGCDGFLLDDDDDETLSDTETTEVKPGLYEITEEEIEGWDLADIDCDNDIILFSQESDYPEYSTDYSREVFVEPGQTVTCTFTNEKRAEVVVTKYNDYNRNGEKDDNEPVLPGWEFTLESEEEDSFDICDIIPTFPGCEGEFDICELIPELCGDFNTFSFFPCGSFPFPPCDDDDYEYFKQQTTGEDGTTTFTDVKPGVDHFLSETEQDGWTWSDTDCEYEDRESYGQVVRENYYEIDASPGERVECFVGNYRDAYMLIEKTNDQPEPVNAGEVVTYTITVTVPEDSNPVYDATVTDLPPEGFVYIPGSETATQGSLTSPYASPGIWSLGDLFPGDIVVLTYQTRIASSASPGTYPDLAFASGCDIDAIAECDDEDEAGCELTKDEVVICDEENAVLANVTNIDKEGTPFVGTEVTIKAPQVLAANILINTGAADVWRNMMVGTLLMGVALAILYRREKKGYKL